MSEKLKKQCQSLYLSGLCHHFEAICKTASEKNWTHHQLLESLFDLELDHRLHKRIQLRLKQAKLPATPTIDSFDFDHHPSRKKNKGRILQLMQLDFIKNSEDVIVDWQSRGGQDPLGSMSGIRGHSERHSHFIYHSNRHD